MATIKSINNENHWTIDTTSKSARITPYNPTFAYGYSHPQAVKYSKLNCGLVSTFRTLGSAATPQVIFTIENGLGSGRLVYIKGLYFKCDVTAALNTPPACQVDVQRTYALPVGGTILNETKTEIGTLGSESVTARGATASDGGAATAITVTPIPGNYISRAFINRQHTLASQTQDNPFMTLLNMRHTEAEDTVLLREGQAIAVSITGTAGSNAATNHYIVSAIWDTCLNYEIYK